MSASSYGIIVEGNYDSGVYDAIIRKLTSPEIHIKPLVCGGRQNLMREFPGLLRAFEHEMRGAPVDMAIILRDADGKDPDEIERQMRARIQGRNYPFHLNVRFHAIRNAMDAWLLADVDAINSATMCRQGKRVLKSQNTPEDLLRPKDDLRKLLADHRVTYTAELCREIAREIDLTVLARRCPRFEVFTELVDC
jgi:hypothetical protein